MDLGGIAAGFGRGLLALGTGGISEYTRARQEEQAKALGSILSSSATPGEAISKMAAIGTPEAAQFAKILADKSQLPTSVQEFNALQAMNPQQQQAYAAFKDPSAALEAQKYQTSQQQAQTAAQGALTTSTDRGVNVMDAIDRAYAKVNGGTAGKGSIWSYLPGTKARDLTADLDTIKANLGFQELQTLRDNSKTGGALGSTSENEIKYLQSVASSLDQAQSPEQLKASLVRAKAQIQKSWQRVATDYQKDYGTIPEDIKQRAGMGQQSLSGLTALPQGYKDIGNGMVQGPDGKKYRKKAD